MLACQQATMTACRPDSTRTRSRRGCGDEPVLCAGCALPAIAACEGLTPQMITYSTRTLARWGSPDASERLVPHGGYTRPPERR